MAKQEWFRRTTWTEAEKDEFYTRLARSRGNKAECLRIQALHLAEIGQYDAAIELLDSLFAKFPDKLHLAQAHLQKALALEQLGRDASATDEFRAALQIEREFPNVKTNAWIDFGWFVAEKGRSDLYGETLSVLQEFRDESGLTFPAIEFRYSAIRAFIADARGDKESARTFAKRALTEASKKHSGLRYHATVGLVGTQSKAVEKRLKAIAGKWWHAIFSKKRKSGGVS